MYEEGSWLVPFGELIVQRLTKANGKPVTREAFAKAIEREFGTTALNDVDRKVRATISWLVRKKGVPIVSERGGMKGGAGYRIAKTISDADEEVAALRARGLGCLERAARLRRVPLESELRLLIEMGEVSE